MIYGKPGGYLYTDDWGTKFKVEGNISIAAVAVLESALRYKNNEYYGVSFSKFTFDFEDGIKIVPRWESENSPEVLRFIEEIKRAAKLIVFL